MSKAIITSAQNLTASWADLGGEQDMRGLRWISLWLTVDINDTQNARVRALGKHTSAGSEEYVLPINTVGASSIAVEDEYYEFTDDADQTIVLTWDLAAVPFVQFQVQAGTVGASAGQIDAAYVTRE